MKGRFVGDTLQGHVVAGEELGAEPVGLVVAHDHTHVMVVQFEEERVGAVHVPHAEVRARVGGE